MIPLRRAWRFWLAEPLIWIFSAFVNPSNLERNFEEQYPYRRQKINAYFRSLISLALLNYLFAFFTYTIGFSIKGAAAFSSYSIFVLNLFLFPVVGLIGGLGVGSAFSLIFGFGAGLVGNIVGSFVFGLALGLLGNSIKTPSGIIALSLVISFAVIFMTGFTLSGESSLVSGFSAGTAMLLLGGGFGLFFGLTGGLAFGLAAGIAYFLGYLRLPFYLVSSPSAIRAYLASRKKPASVFDYLHRSALYWDEHTSLPLPCLKRVLLIAYKESPERALVEIAFITAQRPRQTRVARATLLEIILHDLEARLNLERIAGIKDYLDRLFPAEIRLADPRLAGIFTCLSDASRDAMRAISPVGLPGKRKALEDLQANLGKINPRTAFRDQRLNARLEKVIEIWRTIGRQEQGRLARTAQEVGSLDNPYKPGQFLPLKDSLFVGRSNLAQELEGALSTGSRRPTFLLNGERRMGKTSALQQLPLLLGSSYISVFYNLQQPGLYASAATFLAFLADGIVREMTARALPVGALVYNALRTQQNDAYVYSYFENWLARVEELLERENRTLLLTFDEFEALEEIEESKYMDVRQLLNWMRSIIQFHPRVALLFSGVKIFTEMGTQSGLDWAGYFINVQMVRISFLKPDEASRLILKPTSDYPGEEIFPPAVVTALVNETGCHPFLLQAVCSALITLLNVQRREQATIGDVVLAADRVLEDWNAHFAHLWNRTDNEQRACLRALLALTPASGEQLAVQTQLDEKVIRRALQQLLRRDLVLRDQGEAYSIAVSMFQRWLERNI